MKKIKARVNKRLLSKADRLFTGSLSGRIIEVLQNARRAGATRVEITNKNGLVIVRDNGSGIDDFSRLLDLGGSGWPPEDFLEQSEDPAGIGVFSLAPRKVCVRSGQQQVTLTEKAWSGTPVVVETGDEMIQGTEFQFKDEPWTKGLVEQQAVFSGLEVVVDGEVCEQKQFLTDGVHCRELGCRIQVVESFDEWHRRACSETSSWGGNVIVNFYGHTVMLHEDRLQGTKLRYLVELTGESTGIRLMLPARIRLVENVAFERLKCFLEVEGFRFFQKLGTHLLSYEQFVRARILGVDLPEAEPVFELGLLRNGEDDFVEVALPEGHLLEQCYRLGKDCENVEGNAHLLGALGKCELPFIPVQIDEAYGGYSWAKLPVVERVEVFAGKQLHSEWVWRDTLTCVESLEIVAYTSDGKVFRSSVSMAVKDDEEMYVTPVAEDTLSAGQICSHFGGFHTDDSWDTQLWEMEQQLQEFWQNMRGPDETTRVELLKHARFTKKWNKITLRPSGKVVVDFGDGKKRTLLPPKSKTPDIKEVEQHDAA